MVLKKIISVITILSLMIALPIVAFADEDNNVSLDNNINITTTDATLLTTSVEKEVENITDLDILSDNYGAQVRLLQLKKRVEIQIDGASTLISELENENNLTIDIERLNEIVDEFGVILNEIDNFNMEQDAEILAEEYVSLKTEAIELTKEFREIVGKAFNENKKTEIRNRIRKRRQELLAKKNQKIEEFKKKFNARIAERKLKRLGINNPELIKKIKNGEMDKFMITKELKNKFNSLSPKEKKLAIQKMKEAKKKAEIHNRESIKKLRESISHKREILNRKLKKRNIQRIKTRINHMSSQELRNIKEKMINNEIEITPETIENYKEAISNE